MRCVIISGSPETNVNFINSVVTNDDYVICADIGYQFAKMAGITPNLIVGDFDSCNVELPDNCETVKLNVEKDDTDTVHSIDLAVEKGFDEIIILGALGGRTDHGFANLCALQYISNKGARGVLLSEKERIEFLKAGEYSFDGYSGKTFSLFPFGCSEVCVSYVGVKYPLDLYYLQNSVPMGVSNIFESDSSTISIYDGNAIVIINLLNDNI